MSLKQHILDLQRLPNGPERQRAADALLDLLRALSPYEAGRDRDDLVQHVLVKVLEGVAPTGDSDASVKSWLKSSLWNRWRDVLRQAKRTDGQFARDDDDHQPADPTSELVDERTRLDPTGVPPALQVPLKVLDERSRSWLELAADHAIAQRASRYRTEAEAAWRQMLSLLDGTTFEELVTGELGPPAPDGADGAARTRAVNRIHTNHKRFRGELAQATDDLIAAGRIPPEEAEMARENLLRLRSRQKR